MFKQKVKYVTKGIQISVQRNERSLPSGGSWKASQKSGTEVGLEGGYDPCV